ncbi:MAG: hypothetical protein U0931_16730 [Vulcanimicrobiota bacterium]
MGLVAGFFWVVIVLIVGFSLWRRREHWADAVAGGLVVAASVFMTLPLLAFSLTLLFPMATGSAGSIVTLGFSFAFLCAVASLFFAAVGHFTRGVVPPASEPGFSPESVAD